MITWPGRAAGAWDKSQQPRGAGTALWEGAVQGRDAAGCSKVSAPRAPADRNDDLERTPSPPQGPAAPHRLHPPLPSSSVLQLCHPHSRQQPAGCTAKLQRCALAFPATARAGAGAHPQGHGSTPAHPHRPRGTQLTSPEPNLSLQPISEPSDAAGERSVCRVHLCGSMQQTAMPAGQGRSGVR